MSMVKFLLGRGEFKTIDEIKETVKSSKNFEPREEDVNSAETLLIFQTTKQQTWLVATRKRLYCVLDDINKSFTKVQWSMRKEKIVVNGQIKIDIRTRSYKENTELLDIGDHTDWLLSKNLFTTDKATEKVKRMLISQMID